MAKAVFVHKSNSSYDDLPEKFYHFPQNYLSRVKQTVGDDIVYYGNFGAANELCYWARGKVSGIRNDPIRQDHYYADIADYLEFSASVPYRQKGGYEQKLVMSDGRINGGTAQSAVRLITESEFERIVSDGFSTLQEWPLRDSDNVEEAPQHAEYGELAEEQPPFLDRPVAQLLLNKKFRDAKFRHNILAAYDRRCAFTGLRLINGGGRPEVEAAHIIPVEKNGNDSVRNGIALSGTVHWMFDRGLLSLEDDYSIKMSRHLNYDVGHILNRDLKAIVPAQIHLRPHSTYLEWHRENCFKN